MQETAAHAALQTVAGQRAEIGYLVRGKPLFGPVGGHGAGQRMLRPLLEREGRGQQLIFGHAGRGDDVGDFGFSGGDRAGLVEGDELDAARVLDRLGVFEQDAVLRAHAVADHDGDGGREAQRAGTGDDENGDRALQRVDNVLSGDQPSDQDDDGDADDGGNEDGGDPVSDAGDWGLGGRRVGDHPDDLGERRVLADAGGPRADEAGLVDRGGGDAVALLLVHGDGFARERGLVDRGGAFQDHAVDRDRLAGADDEDVAGLHLVDADDRLDAVPFHRGRFRSHAQKILQRIGRAALGKGFQRLAHGDQAGDHRGGFEIQFVVIDLHQVRVRRSPGDHHGHLQENVERPEEGNGRSQSDQGVHVRTEPGQAAEAGREEIPVDVHHDQRDEHLDDAQAEVVVGKEGGKGRSEHVVSHRDIHQDHEPDHGTQEPLFQAGRLPVLQGVLFGSQLLAGGRTVPSGLAFRLGAVAGLLDGKDDVGRGGGPFHRHRVGQKGDRDLLDPRQGGHGFLDMGLARGAGHARNDILRHVVLLTSSASAEWRRARRWSHRRRPGCPGARSRGCAQPAAGG